MPARKYSASMDSDLLDEVERAAAEAGLTVSAWMAQVARDRLALEGLARLIDDWEAEHGAFTEEELRAAKHAIDHPLTPEQAMRLSRRPRRRSA